MKNISIGLIAILLLMFSSTLSAQISQGGIPYSFTNAIQFQNKIFCNHNSTKPRLEMCLRQKMQLMIPDKNIE